MIGQTPRLLLDLQKMPWASVPIATPLKALESLDFERSHPNDVRCQLNILQRLLKTSRVDTCIVP